MAGGSSIPRATDIDFLLDTNIRPPKNSPAPEPPVSRALRAALEAAQFEFPGILDQFQGLRSKALLLIVFSSLLPISSLRFLQTGASSDHIARRDPNCKLLQTQV
jgi:hypothetical protein